MTRDPLTFENADSWPANFFNLRIFSCYSKNLCYENRCCNHKITCIFFILAKIVDEICIIEICLRYLYCLEEGKYLFSQMHYLNYTINCQCKRSTSHPFNWIECFIGCILFFINSPLSLSSSVSLFFLFLNFYSTFLHLISLSFSSLSNTFFPFLRFFVLLYCS